MRKKADGKKTLLHHLPGHTITASKFFGRLPFDPLVSYEKRTILGRAAVTVKSLLEAAATIFFKGSLVRPLFKGGF